MKLEDKVTICEVLTASILRAQMAIRSESHVPAHSVDESEELVRQAREEVEKLRKIRELVEEL